MQNESSSPSSESATTVAPTPRQYTLQVHRGTSEATPYADLLEKQKQENSYRQQLFEILKTKLPEGTKVTDIAFAEYLQQHHDNLKEFRERFHYPTKDPENPQSGPLLYFCGNSLGLQPKTTAVYMQEELQKWAKYGVQGHFVGERPWFKIEDTVTETTAAVVGALREEVAVMNSLTLNVHLGMLAFYRPTPTRHKILIEENPFPSDMHAVVSQIRLHDYDPEQSLLQVGPRAGETFIRTEDILEVIEKEGDSIDLVMLSGIHFSSGQAFDIPRITAAAKKKGCKVGFDLAHAAGNLELKLHDWEVDFACWCNYKYLNSGPGTIAGFFLHNKHAKNTELKRFSGWWGHNRDTRFKVLPNFDPMGGAASFQLSNPSVVSIICVMASLEIFKAAGMSNLRKKSLLLTSYLELLLDSEFDQNAVDAPFIILTPRDPEQRGAQISLRISSKFNIKKVMKKIEANHLICDERDPDIIRIAPAPLYNNFEEVYQVVQVLKKVFAAPAELEGPLEQ